MSMWTDSLWQQFGAAIDTLDNAIQGCPDLLWTARLWEGPPGSNMPPGFAEFWYIAYHTLFWIDFYLYGSEKEFVPHPPFTSMEFDPAGKLPETPYTREELREFLRYVREKCRTTVTQITDEDACRACSFPWSRGEVISFYELQLYNMRHVQEHAAQLNMLLGQHVQNAASDWVPRADG